MTSYFLDGASFFDYEYEISLLSAALFLLFVFSLLCQAVFLLGKTLLLLLRHINVFEKKATHSAYDTERASGKTRSSLLSRTFSRTTTLGLLALGLELPWVLRQTAYSSSGTGLAHLIHGTDARLQRLLERLPTLLEGPKPPLRLLGMTNRHLQFLPWLIQNEIHQLPGVRIPYQRLHLPVLDWNDKSQKSNTVSNQLPPVCAAQEKTPGDSDGVNATPTNTTAATTSTCQADARIMKDTITVDIFPPLSTDKSDHTSFNQSSPIIVFSPGLTCHSQDLPGNMIVRRAYERGFRSAVINRRGHTPDQKLQSPRWNLFGDVDDLEQAYWFLREQVAPHTAFFLHGISSGTGLVVSALSKWDDRRRHSPHLPTPTFVASVSVTPGYDTSKALNRERFRFPYQDFLLHRVKDHFVRANELVLRQHDNETVDQVLGATNLQDLVDEAAPFAGYANATAYYQDTNPINNMDAIATPKLVLNSLDDPCCSIRNLFDQSPHPWHNGKTYAEIVSHSQFSMVAVTWTGSHCPFLSWSDHGWLPLVRDAVGGGWMLNSWADQVSIDFYHAALEVYGDRQFL